MPNELEEETKKLRIKILREVLGVDENTRLNLANDTTAYASGVIYIALEHAKEFYQTKLAELEESHKNGVEWFNAFQRVEDFMHDRNLWDETDIVSDNPADTLIRGVTRNLAKLEKAEPENTRLKQSNELLRGLNNNQAQTIENLQDENTRLKDLLKESLNLSWLMVGINHEVLNSHLEQKCTKEAQELIAKIKKEIEDE